MINENNTIATNSFPAWYLAARPKTLTGAATPVIIGIALAWKDAGTAGFQWLMQIDSNFINDYFDYIRGNDDTATRLGPKRACSEGWITLPAMKRGIIITSILASLIGAPLIIYGGWQMIAVGAACVLFAFLYTTVFSYHGMGDLLVLVFFGIVPVCLTYYVIMPTGMQTIPQEVFVISVACGLIIDTLLCINNDRKDGKRTLVVRLGEKAGTQLYLITGLTGCFATFATLLFSALHQSLLGINLLGVTLFFFYLVLHIKAFKSMKQIGRGRELNKVLGLTARNMFVYGIITSFNIILLSIA